MNLHRQDAIDLAKAVADRAGDHADVVLCPAYPYLATVSETLCAHGTTHVTVGGQNVYHQAEGAYTGEVSTGMLKDVGAQWVILGHSERRHVIGESDVLINAKVHAALNAGLKVILCIGETLDQREANQTDAINAGQLSLGLAGVTAGQTEHIVIAYEPVWAIGTGKTATPDDAQAAHAAIRSHLTYMFGEQTALQMRIQYGGSVKPDNAKDLFSQNDIDGGLIGGA
ncbi:MAG: triose-phosphate isomerase, partial [Phycisphaeraceae bacterium]